VPADLKIIDDDDFTVEKNATRLNMDDATNLIDVQVKK